MQQRTPEPRRRLGHESFIDCLTRCEYSPLQIRAGKYEPVNTPPIRSSSICRGVTCRSVRMSLLARFANRTQQRIGLPPTPTPKPRTPISVRSTSSTGRGRLRCLPMFRSELLARRAVPLGGSCSCHRQRKDLMRSKAAGTPSRPFGFSPWTPMAQGRCSATASKRSPTWGQQLQMGDN